MTCKVTVKGEDKDKFEFLSSKFGPRIALQSILDAEPNVEIDGFLSEVEIGNRVNAITFSVLRHIVQDAGGKSVLDIAENAIQMVQLDKSLAKAKQDLELILSNALNEGTIEGKNIALRAFVALQNFDELTPKIVQRIESFSLSVTEKNNLLSEIAEEEERENVKDRIYSQSNIETNRLDSVSPQVKLYIATLPMEKFDEEGNVVPVLDDLGMSIPVDFHSIYSLLSKNLADKSTMEEMLDTLETLSEENTTVDTIYQDLINGSMESDKEIVLHGRKIKSFENAFFSSFANTFNDSITVTTELKTSKEGEKYISSSIYKTNKRELHRVLRNKWAQENRRIVNLAPKTKLNIWSNKLQEVFNPLSKVSRDKYEKEKAKLYAKTNDFRNKAVLIDIQESLELVGIVVSEQGLSILRKEMNRYNKEAFAEFVYGDTGSILNLGRSAWKDGKDTFTSETTLINKIARAESKVANDISAGSYMNGEGNQVYPLNLPTAASELFNDLKNKKQRLVDFFSHPMMSYFRILKQFKSTPKSLEFALFDTLYNNNDNEGISFDALDPASSIITRIKAFMNYGATGVANTKEGWFMTPTPADRSKTSVFKMQKLKNTDFSFEGLVNFGEYKEWVNNMIQGEFERVQLVRKEYNEQPDKSKLVKEYHYNSETKELGNGGFFNYYPSLNQFLQINSDGELQQIDLESPEVAKVIKDTIIAQLKNDIDYLELIGVIKPLNLNPKGDKIYEGFKASDHVKSMIEEKALNDKNIMSFLVNSIVATHELSVMFNGDLAFFKPMDIANDNQTIQLADANKRAGLSETPGRKLRVGINGSNASFNVAFANDITASSSLYDMYAEILGKDHTKKYLAMDVTDGQGIVSLDRYADIMAGLGQLTPALATTINELKKTNPDTIDWSKVTEPLQPIKGFLQTNRFDPVFDRVMFQNLKYSLLPIIPSAISKNSTMQHIYKKMVEARVDEFVFVSGAKGGAYNINDITQEGKLSTVKMSNYDWRMPQVVPYKTKTYENFGTQIRKLIMGNIQKDGNYNGVSGEQLQATYQLAISEKLKNSFKELLEDISFNGKVDIGLVARKVLNDLSKNTFKSTSDFITKALEVVTLADGTQDTRIPMSFPAIKHRVESSLNSLIRKAITKQTLPGFSAVQYTGLGYGQESSLMGELQKELKFVRLSEDKTTVLPAEVIISPQYFIQSLKKKRNEKNAVEIDTLIEELKSGNFDIDKIPNSLREVVLYRIPTQGKNSMLPAIVKGFTPEGMGSTIVIPAEITTQSGADYDIDKVYIEFKHFSYNEGFETIQPTLNSKEGIDNTIVTTHFDVLTSLSHFKELITPNNINSLNKLVSEISAIYEGDKTGRLWSSLATQDDFREKNQAGGIFIGIASIANTAHALFQELGVSLSSRSVEGTGVMINGKEVSSLSNTYTYDKTGKLTSRLISDDHMEIQNAAVDNAKNPILGNLNINTTTGSTYLFLIEAGAGLEYATKLLNTPIIRELTNLTRRNEATMGKDGAFQSALKELTTARDIDLTLVISQDFDISEGILNDVLGKAKNGTFISVYDADILKAFLTFRKYGTDLHEVQAALTTDNVGAHQTLAANIIHWDKLAKVQGTYANETYSKEYPSDELKPITTIKLDREKYKNHSIQAYEVFGLKKAIDLVSTFMVDSTPTFKKVLKSFQNGIGGNMVESDLRLLVTDFYTYLFTNNKAHYEDKSSALANYSSLDIAKLLVGTNSVGNRVLKAQKEEVNKAKEDISYIPNQFIMSLTVELNEKRSGYDVVSFNNTISKTLSSDQKTMLSSEIMKMFLSEEESLNSLGQDLFLYNFFTEGFGRGVNSFSDYIPVELYELVQNPDTQENLVEYFRNIREDFNDQTLFSTDDFLVKFLLNRAYDLKGLKNLTSRNPTQVKEFLEGNPTTNYFLTKSGGKVVVAKRRGKSNTYDGLGELVGVKNIHVEYQNDTYISQGKTPTDVYTLAKASEDIIDNDQCSI